MTHVAKRVIKDGDRVRLACAIIPSLAEALASPPSQSARHNPQPTLALAASPASAPTLKLSLPRPQTQTFDGTTLSSLLATLNASLRETVDSAAAALRPAAPKDVAAAEEEKEEVVAVAMERVEALEAELAAAEAAVGDEDDVENAPMVEADDEADDEEMAEAAALSTIRGELAAAREALESARAKPAPPKAARGDA